MSVRIIRLPEAKHLTGLSRSNIYARMLAGTFPQSIPLGPKSVGWLESEILQWIEQQASKRSRSTSVQSEGL